MEVVVAAALFATAAIALGRLAKTASAISLQADQRLSAQFTAENTLARLNAIPLEDVATSSQRIADEVSQESGYRVTVSADEFSLSDSSDEPALHLVVKIEPNTTLHDWRIKEQRND